MADFSPMMKQYFEAKKENPDSILFFRLGDFYETTPRPFPGSWT